MKEKRRTHQYDDDDEDERGSDRGGGGGGGRGDRGGGGRGDRGDRGDRGGGGSGGNVPEITVTDQGAPLFDLDWLNACADRVVFDKRTESLLKEVFI